MDILRQIEEVAAKAWAATSKKTERITQTVLETPGIEGWAIASIYEYHCFPEHDAYAVIIWRNNGIRDGLTVMQIRGMLVQYHKDTDTYAVESIMRIL
jgi:hypothetical protein